MNLLDLLIALTDMQVDQLLSMFQRGMSAVGEGIKTVWLALSPTLITYMLLQQAKNRKALTAEIAANSKISTDAFEVANGHNGKIAALNRELLDLKIKQSETPRRH